MLPFYNDCAVATQWYRSLWLAFLYVMAIIKSHRDATPNSETTEISRKLCFLAQSLLVYTSISYIPSLIRECKKTPKEYAHLAETVGRNKGIKSSNTCRYFKGKFYFRNQYLMQTSLSGIFFNVYINCSDKAVEILYVFPTCCQKITCVPSYTTISLSSGKGEKKQIQRNCHCKNEIIWVY